MMLARAVARLVQRELGHVVKQKPLSVAVVEPIEQIARELHRHAVGYDEGLVKAVELVVRHGIVVDAAKRAVHLGWC